MKWNRNKKFVKIKQFRAFLNGFNGNKLIGQKNTLSILG